MIRLYLPNGNDIFTKNIEKVRRTFYHQNDIPLQNKQIVIKGRKKNVHQKLNLSLPLSNQPSPKGIKWRTNIQNYPNLNGRYGSFVKTNCSDEEEKEKSLPPLNSKNLRFNRRSINDEAVYQSLEVDRFKDRGASDSLDVTNLDLKTINIHDGLNYDWDLSVYQKKGFKSNKKFVNKTEIRSKLEFMDLKLQGGPKIHIPNKSSRIRIPKGKRNHIINKSSVNPVFKKLTEKVVLKNPTQETHYSSVRSSSITPFNKNSTNKNYWEPMKKVIDVFTKFWDNFKNQVGEEKFFELIKNRGNLQ